MLGTSSASAAPRRAVVTGFVAANVFLMGGRAIAADGGKGKAHGYAEVFDGLDEVGSEKDTAAEALIDFGADEFTKHEVFRYLNVLVVVGLASLGIEEIIDIDEAFGSGVGVTDSVDVALGKSGIGLHLEANA
jgi:hypothetical protein